VEEPQQGHGNSGLPPLLRARVRKARCRRAGVVLVPARPRTPLAAAAALCLRFCHRKWRELQLWLCHLLLLGVTLLLLLLLLQLDLSRALLLEVH
jgi:hypothetical protein